MLSTEKKMKMVPTEKIYWQRKLYIYRNYFFAFKYFRLAPYIWLLLTIGKIEAFNPLYVVSNVSVDGRKSAVGRTHIWLEADYSDENGTTVCNRACQSTSLVTLEQIIKLQ